MNGITVRFLAADGQLAATARAGAGRRLLDVARDAGLPLEGTCEGAMACSTCHVLVSDRDHGRLPPPQDAEEDMLDFTAHAGPTSRLACQILLQPALDGLEVRLPPSHADLSLL